MNHLKVLDCAIQDKLEKLKQPEKKKNGLLKRKPSNYTLRAAGSILHDFYTGIENIFGDIAKKGDRRMPARVTAGIASYSIR